MPNHKDIEELDYCVFCGINFDEKPIHDDCHELNHQRYILKQHEQREEIKHYPGCHKVHIECANKTIEIAATIISDYVDGHEPGMGAVAWLESFGGEE